MAGPVISELDARRRRRLITASLLRASATTVVLVVLYYVLPMNETLHLSAVMRLFVGLLVLAVVIAWQVRSILHSRYPGIRAVEVLAVVGPLFLLIFASTYFLMAAASPVNFSERLSRTDALYFTVTTFATVGFGDITAVSQLARSIVTVQMILDLLLLGLGLRAFLGAIRIGRERRAGADGEAGPISR